MTSKIAAIAAKKVLGSEFKKYADKNVGGDYDPLFEMRPDKRGRMKKCKKLIPAYIPEEDAVLLAKVRKRAYRLDMALFNFMGIRFGWSSVIGLIPALGDVADLIMSVSLFRACCKVKGGLDSGVKLQMLLWIFVDFVIGFVPFVGDLLDASIKANCKNCRMLEQHLDRKYKPENQKTLEREKRKSDPHYKPAAPATVYEDSDDDERDYYSPPSDYRSRSREPERPGRAHTGRRDPEPDLEMGLDPAEGRNGSRKTRR